jgi:hypothetical protein
LLFEEGVRRVDSARAGGMVWDALAQVVRLSALALSPAHFDAAMTAFAFQLKRAIAPAAQRAHGHALAGIACLLERDAPAELHRRLAGRFLEAADRAARERAAHAIARLFDRGIPELEHFTPRFAVRLREEPAGGHVICERLDDILCSGYPAIVDVFAQAGICEAATDLARDGSRRIREAAATLLVHCIAFAEDCEAMARSAVQPDCIATLFTMLESDTF